MEENARTRDRKERLKEAIIQYQTTRLYPNELGKMVMDLSSSIVYKNFKDQPEKDELISIALLGVSEVLLKVDTTQSANTINNYLWICGKSAIKNSMAKARVESKKIAKYKTEVGENNYDTIDSRYSQDHYYNGKKQTRIEVDA